MTANLSRRDGRPVLWQVLPGLTSYCDAIASMHAEQERIADGTAREAVWLLESAAGFNAGSASRMDQVPSLPVPPASALQAPAAAGKAPPALTIDVPAGPPRAGDWTYHGPGVRGGIVMLNLAARRKDIGSYVDLLHQWLIAAVAKIGVKAARRPELEGAGLWVGESKLAAIGLNWNRWVTGYGFGLYVAPDMTNFAALPNPCGVVGKSVTSLATELRGAVPAMADVDAALRDAFHDCFGPTSLVS